jgi:hypothetical protein
MDSYKPPRLFGPDDQCALLAAMSLSRRHVARLRTVASADSERFRLCEEVTAAIERLAADLTGDESYFYARPKKPVAVANEELE